MNASRSYLLTLLLLAPATMAATSATPAAKAEIDKYAGPYPSNEMLTLKNLYRRHLEEAGYERSVVERDVSYGSHERQKLDVLKPTFAAARPRPVLVFVHGGGFVSGSKSDGDIFDNVLDFFTRHDVLGVNLSYRLAPDHPYPAAAEDLRDALDWIAENAVRYGGDPQNLFLLGHSAGAVHVANVTFMNGLHPKNGRLKGSILMSGIYGVGDDTQEHVYFGRGEPEVLRLRTPLAQVSNSTVPLFVIDAEHDPLIMQRSALELISAVCERDGKCPRHQQIAGHNHYSMTYHINTLDDSIASEILDFIVALSAAPEPTGSP